MTAVNVLRADTVTTKGDLLIATAAGTIVRHAVPATAGQVMIADPIATDGWTADYPLDRAHAYLRPTGAIAETFPRSSGSSIGAANTLTSGTLRLTAIALPADRDISSITVMCNSAQAAVNPTHQWFSLHDSSRVMLALTTDDTTTAWAISTAKTLSIATIAAGASATFRTTYAGLYYVGIMVTADTPPGQNTVTGTGAINGLAPILSGNSTTGLTTPPAFPLTAAAITASGNTAYAYVS